MEKETIRAVTEICRPFFLPQEGRESSRQRTFNLFKAESTFDGFYAVSTNLEDSAEEIVRISTGGR